MTDGWRLPSGATGFWGPRSARLADTDRRAFATYAYEAARLSGGRVLAIAPAGATPNFHTAVIVRGEVRLALLGHAHLPLTPPGLRRRFRKLSKSVSVTAEQIGGFSPGGRRFQQVGGGGVDVGAEASDFGGVNAFLTRPRMRRCVRGAGGRGS